MGYCFMSTQKVKTLGQLKSKYRHNHRLANVENADPALKHLNRELVSCLNANGEPIDYVEAWKERIDSLDYYKDHRVRSNAVLATEVIMTFSRSEKIDLEAWQKKNVEWLEKTFNIAGDGKSNILDVTFHADEPGNVHLHALIIPIDERGHLNASRFTNGSSVMSRMQSSYARDMEEFGLERGLRGSTAKHKDIRKFYADLNQAMESVPEPHPSESAYEYKMRVFENLRTLHASFLRESKERERELIEIATRNLNRQKEELRQLLREKQALEKSVDKLTASIQALKETQKEIEQNITASKAEQEELKKITSMTMEEYRAKERIYMICDTILKNHPDVYEEASRSVDHILALEKRDEQEIQFV